MSLKLVLIGLVAGLFSALFGVGGGIVIVPLLILLARLRGPPRDRTSLAAIGITALAGTILYAFEGHVTSAMRPSSVCRQLPVRWREPPSSSASPARALTLAFAGCSPRSPSGCSYERDHDRAGPPARLHGGRAGGLFRRRRRNPVRPDARRARASQLGAEATSLLAILPTVAAGTWRQRRYGNVRWRTALVLGVSSIAGAAVGVQVATALPEDTLRRLFALFLLAVAAQLAWRARRPAPYP